MIKYQALQALWDDEEAINSHWDKIFDRYDAQFDKIAGKMGLEELLADMVVSELERAKLDQEVFKQWADNFGKDKRDTVLSILKREQRLVNS